MDQKANAGPSGSSIYEALAKAQQAFPSIEKDATNPHFNKKYASLANIHAAVRKPLFDNGLLFFYTVRSGSIYEAFGVEVTTTIYHWSTGQTLTMAIGASCSLGNPQAIGSAITYLKRYGLSALLTVVAEDEDDGEAARPPARAERPAAKPPQRPPTRPPAKPPAAATTAAGKTVVEGVEFPQFPSIAGWGVDRICTFAGKLRQTKVLGDFYKHCRSDADLYGDCDSWHQVVEHFNRTYTEGRANHNFDQSTGFEAELIAQWEETQRRKTELQGKDTFSPTEGPTDGSPTDPATPAV